MKEEEWHNLIENLGECENDTRAGGGREKGHSFGRGRGAIWRLFSGFPGGSGVQNLPANAGNMGSIPGSRRSHWRREWLPIPVYLPEEFHGQTEESGGLLCTGTQRVRHDWAHMLEVLYSKRHSHVSAHLNIAAFLLIRSLILWY